MPQDTHVSEATNPQEKSSTVGAGLLSDVGDGTEPLLMIDRSAPGWAKPLSWFFSLGTGACILGACILTIFFLDMAAYPQEPMMAVILACVGLIPVLGILIFEFSHAKALSGYRIFRMRNSTISQAYLALAAFFLLEFVHPLLGLAIPFGAALSYCSILAFNRLGRSEPLWDFLPQEAISILAGRDEIGRKLAIDKPQNHPLLKGFLRAGNWFAAVLAFAVASWLAARDILSPTAVPAVGLITLWAVTVVSRFLVQRSHPDPWKSGLASSVTRLRADVSVEGEGSSGGLRVEGLTVF